WRGDGRSAMPAFGGKAHIGGPNVRFVPEADIEPGFILRAVDQQQSRRETRQTRPPYSAARLLRVVSLSFWMSAGESFGRSILSVTLLSLPVNLKGTW